MGRKYAMFPDIVKKKKSVNVECRYRYSHLIAVEKKKIAKINTQI